MTAISGKEIIHFAEQMCLLVQLGRSWWQLVYFDAYQWHCTRVSCWFVYIATACSVV